MPPAGTEGMGFAIFYTKDNDFLLGKVWTDLLAVYKKNYFTKFRVSCLQGTMCLRHLGQPALSHRPWMAWRPGTNMKLMLLAVL